MTILAVDSRADRLEELAGCLREVFPAEEIVAFADPGLAVQHSFRTQVDLVFAGADTRRLSGVQVAQGVRFFRPEARAFLVAEANAREKPSGPGEISGRLTYPVTPEAVRAAVSQASVAEPTDKVRGANHR